MSQDCSVLDALQIGVILLDQDARVLRWNRWCAAHLIPCPEAPGGRALVELFPELAGSRLATCIQQALSFSLSSMLTPGLNRPLLPLYQKPEDAPLGRRMQQLVQITALRRQEAACLIQIQDMTANVRRERRLRMQSTQLLDATYRDALTGVGNRRRFDHAFAELVLKAQAAASSLGLIMIDVDHFKAYNDRHGHQQGDDCLRLVAQTLRQGLRQDAGDLLCRYGGEEFAVLLPGADTSTTCGVAERLRQRIEALNPLPGNEDGFIAISLGLASAIPGEDAPAHTLITGADLALYHAKEEGRNRCLSYHLDSHEVHPCP